MLRLIRSCTLALGLIAASAAFAAPPPPPTPVTPASILAAAPPGDWRGVDPEDLMVLDLAGGGRVVIELAPLFAPVHVANIKLMARAGWYDGLTVERVQDNYVVQWGDPSPRAPPSAVTLHPPAEYERPAAGLAFDALPYRDTYADRVGFVRGWPTAESDDGEAWLTHCYGMVGVGRDLNPDTGSGTELYAIIGQPARALDRNIALVGRVLSGMDLLAAQPRGPGAMGFYADPRQGLKILKVRIAADLPAAERPAFAMLATDSATFKAWIHVRANRQDTFFLRPAGAIDVCGALPPIRIIHG
jgi:peptidylprolyl isomerase